MSNELLTPEKVRQIRKEVFGITSRKEFSELVGFGVASIQRWESGTLRQGQANDKYLRLLQHTAKTAGVSSLSADDPAAARSLVRDIFKKEDV
tara:strand:+ start:330 stop:608 length:279 start_codon:yes stop_codon:yes gene_type:complete